MLGGNKGRKSRYLTAPETLDETPEEESDEYSEDQFGEGLNHLKNTCDHVEVGNHNEAWSSLYKARMLKVDRNKFKKVENYLDSFRK